MPDGAGLQGGRGREAPVLRGSRSAGATARRRILGPAVSARAGSGRRPAGTEGVPGPPGRGLRGGRHLPGGARGTVRAGGLLDLQTSPRKRTAPCHALRPRGPVDAGRRADPRSAHQRARAQRRHGRCRPRVQPHSRGPLSRGRRGVLCPDDLGGPAGLRTRSRRGPIGGRRGLRRHHGHGTHHDGEVARRPEDSCPAAVLPDHRRTLRQPLPAAVRQWVSAHPGGPAPLLAAVHRRSPAAG